MNVDLVMMIMEVVASIAAFVRFLPLANRVRFHKHVQLFYVLQKAARLVMVSAVLFILRNILNESEGDFVVF